MIHDFKITVEENGIERELYYNLRKLEFPSPSTLKESDIFNSKKPTRGIKPRALFLEGRLLEIDEAIDRRLQAKQKIPVSWIEERNSIIKSL